MISSIGLLEIVFYLLLILLSVKPLGGYIARVYEGKVSFMGVVGRYIEHPLYRLCGIQVQQEMSWKQYLSAMLVFNLFSILATYLIQRFQGHLPLNPQGFPAPHPALAWNTAVSFMTNTDWQAYSGESTLSYLTQMLALTTQNFLSAATGLSLLMAFIRGLVHHESESLGNFWVDTSRGILYILLPLACIFSCVLVSQGVLQTFKPNQIVHLIQPNTSQSAQKSVLEQVIPMGPVASQIAIKQLGTNGGGFFNVNAAHPFENPTPVTNFLEMLALMLIPAALCYTFGVMVHDKRQGWGLLTVMFIVFIPCVLNATIFEQQGNPALTHLGVLQNASIDSYPGGNMEGKETRFGIVSSTLWSAATTATSNGSVNSMLDSYQPLAGLIPLLLMQFGEVIFGGLGSGLYGMLIFVIITVFVAGLMVGRTPEYLGKKIEPFEMKMASIAVLLMPLIVLISTAFGAVTTAGVSATTNPGSHGFTEILYAFTSMGNNNGSAFSGLNADTDFYNLLGGVVMLIGRYWVAVPLLAIAGSLVQKRQIPESSGTLATHTSLFLILLVGVIILIGALSFLPALALGPIVEQLMLWGQYGG